MSLGVDPEELRLLGQGLSGIAEQSRDAESYARTWLSLDGGGGVIFGDVIDKVDRVREALLANYQRLGVATEETAGRVTVSGVSYSATEHSNETGITGIEIGGGR